MNGIASLLDQPLTVRVEAIWRELEVNFGLTGAKITSLPHVSWQVVENFDFPRFESILVAISRQAKPLTVHTAGLGLFTGESPIVYLSLVKDEPLLRFHAMLWEQLHPIAVNPSPLYAPDAWMPHITLAYGDVRRDNLTGIVQHLAFQTFDWEIELDNLIYMPQSEVDAIETCCVYRFGA